jgi:ectoine hydroxylase-related dioxygenase (phytanoyl-CoA dioxygenase family)
MLSKMVFARLHFDRTTMENGAMELAVGSHHVGGVAASDAKTKAEEYPIEICEAEPGDVLFVSALTLHRSRAARIDSKRRALRVDYSATALPDPLQWAFGE